MTTYSIGSSSDSTADAVESKKYGSNVHYGLHTGKIRKVARNLEGTGIDLDAKVAKSYYEAQNKK